MCVGTDRKHELDIVSEQVPLPFCEERELRKRRSWHRTTMSLAHVELEDLKTPLVSKS